MERNMEKNIILALAFILISAITVNARTQYDITGRTLKDDTLRGQKRAHSAAVEAKRKMHAAAAAKLNYEQAVKNIEDTKTKNEKNENEQKSNYYQENISK